MKGHPVLKWFIVAIAVVIAWQFLVKPVLRRIKGFDEVEWRGQKFKLKQKYLDYDEYKSDSDQLAPEEVEHVKRVMLAISVPMSARSDQDLTQSLRGMRFPGFGSSYNGNVKDEQGNRYILFEFEIPQKQQERTLLYRVNSDGSCERVLDGISAEHQTDPSLANTEVKVEHRMLKHLSEGKVYRQTALDTPK